jgi:hypothetical protein
MRLARKASSRPSHARVPGFTRPPAPARRPAVATLSVATRCRVLWNAPAGASCARGAAARRGKGLVPLRSSSRTCKSRTVPFSKARTMSSIESSPDAWACKDAGGRRSATRQSATRTYIPRCRAGSTIRWAGRPRAPGIWNTACRGSGSASRRAAFYTRDMRRSLLNTKACVPRRGGPLPSSSGGSGAAYTLPSRTSTCDTIARHV